MIGAMARALGIDLDTPFDDLEGRHRRVILHGSGDAWFRSRPKGSARFRVPVQGAVPGDRGGGAGLVHVPPQAQGMVDDVPCVSCMGARLRDDSAAVRFRDFTRSTRSATGRSAGP